MSSANALGRVGGITCPFIVSRDTSLRTIGIVMFSVSIMASFFVKYLPETTGKALGNFDVCLKEQTQGQPSHPMLSGQQLSCSISTILSSSSNDDVANKTTGRRFSGGDQTDEGGDERNISSFEII